MCLLFVILSISNQFYTLYTKVPKANYTMYILVLPWACLVLNFVTKRTQNIMLHCRNLWCGKPYPRAIMLEIYMITTDSEIEFIPLRHVDRKLKVTTTVWVGIDNVISTWSHLGEWHIGLKLYTSTWYPMKRNCHKTNMYYISLFSIFVFLPNWMDFQTISNNAKKCRNLEYPNTILSLIINLLPKYRPPPQLHSCL